MPAPDRRAGRAASRHIGAMMLVMACAACDQPPRQDAVADASCDDAAVREVVTDFGDRLQRVSTTASDSLVVRALRAEYASLVTADLLAEWTASPARTPGRDVSSPWPDRIDVRDVRTVNGACVVAGEVVYVTSVEEGTDSAAAREPVTLRVVREEDEWRIAAYDIERTDPPASSADSAVAVIRRYYEAIDARDYAAARALWSDGGRDGRMLNEFDGRVEAATDVSVGIGEPGRIEGAAGSRYITIPVEVRVVGSGGAARRFTGTYVLRRSVVDGATAEQRQWRIYSADLAAA